MVRKLILERLADLGLTMAEVSKAIGRNETYLHQFMKRGVPAELHERERAKLAEVLKVQEDQLRGPSAPLPKRDYVKTRARESFIDTNTRFASNDPHRTIPAAELFGNVDLPVFGTAQGGEGSLIITDQAVDWVPRPSVLLRVADGYAMIVSGDSMDPALRAGSTALINPHLPARVGDLCLFRSHRDDGANLAAIKEYRGETETHWKVRQYNPPKDFTFKKSDWQVRHRIVGNYFP